MMPTGPPTPAVGGGGGGGGVPAITHPVFRENYASLGNCWFGIRDYCPKSAPAHRPRRQRRRHAHAHDNDTHNNENNDDVYDNGNGTGNGRNEDEEPTMMICTRVPVVALHGHPHHVTASEFAAVAAAPVPTELPAVWSIARRTALPTAQAHDAGNPVRQVRSWGRVRVTCIQSFIHCDYVRGCLCVVKGLSG